MKYFVIFLLCCVAFAAAAPQLFTAGYPGVYPYVPNFGRTVVAGPTVVNGFGTRFTAPGYIGYV